jgi:hypothetical protein
VISPVLGRYIEFIGTLAESAFRDYVSAITATRLGPVTIEPHQMTAGEFIRFHSDARANRRIGLIM